MILNIDRLLTIVFVLIVNLLNAQISFEKHIIESELDLVSSIAIADFDGDGFQDIANTSWNTNEVFWWKNVGTNPVSLEKYTICDSLTSASFIVHTDIDNDNDIDLIVSGWGNNSINIFFNDGSDPIVWNIMTIEDSFNWAHEIRVADIDNDGYTDIIGASTNLNEVAWWKNPGVFDTGDWSKYIIENQCKAVRTVYPGDIDNDGRLDLVTASFDDNNLYWYKNNSDLTWSKFEIEDFFLHPHMVHLADINNDGYLDISCAGYSGFPNNSDVACWLNDGLNQDNWTLISIDKMFNGALSITSADIDIDGDIDIIGTAELNSNKVAVWLNNGSANEWEKIIVDGFLNGAWGINCADIDSDGDIDISCGGDKHLVWYENTSQLGLSVEDENLDKRIYLNSYPNPFNPSVSISFIIEKDSYVSISVFDLSGNKVCTLIRDRSKLSAGDYTTNWDGKDDNGQQVSSGTYIVNIRSDNFSKSKKICLLR